MYVYSIYTICIYIYTHAQTQGVPFNLCSIYKVFFSIKHKQQVTKFIIYYNTMKYIYII